MDKLSHVRFSLLQDLGNCPVCCAIAWVHSGDQKLFTVLYKCGAVFDVKAGAAIEHLTPCPAPSAVAAKALEREAQAAAGTQAAMSIGGAA